MKYAPHQLDELDFAISAALTLLPEKERSRPPILTTLKHATRWTHQIVINPAVVAAEVAAADTADEFDAALATALVAVSGANAIRMGVGMNFGAALTSSIQKRRTDALVAEAADVAEQLRPVVEKTQTELMAAAADLPKGADALDAEAILAAGSGEPWTRAHEALAVLLIVAGVTPRPSIGDGDWQISSDLRHLQSVLSMIEVVDAGTRIHDHRGVDLTVQVNPEGNADIADIRTFTTDTRDLAPTAIMLSVAQNRWPAVKLAYEPTASVALDRIRNANTSRMVTTEQIRTYEAGVRKIVVR